MEEGRVETMIRIKGELGVDEDTILRFHPELEELLREIRERGWKYSLVSVKGQPASIATHISSTQRPHPWASRPPRLACRGHSALHSAGAGV